MLFLLKNKFVKLHSNQNITANLNPKTANKMNYMFQLYSTMRTNGSRPVFAHILSELVPANNAQ